MSRRRGGCDGDRVRAFRDRHDYTAPGADRYDALLGGKDNYAADRQAVRQLLKAAPEARDSARANRAFLQRAARFLAGEAGIRQFLDIGSASPPQGTCTRSPGRSRRASA
jgi:hypothetical protein